MYTHLKKGIGLSLVLWHLTSLAQVPNITSSPIQKPQVEQTNSVQIQIGRKKPGPASDQEPVKPPREGTALEKSLQFSIEGGIAGGGGNHIGLMFQADTAQAILQLKKNLSDSQFLVLKKRLESTKYFVVTEDLTVTDAQGKIQRCAAKNDPTVNTIYVHETRWPSIKDKSYRLYLAAHELLSLAGIESTGDYHLSSKLLAQQGAAVAKTESNVAQQGVLLFSVFDKPDSTGLDGSSVAELCQQIKDKYEGKYYFVYCSFLRKNIGKIHECVTTESINQSSSTFLAGILARAYSFYRVSSSTNYRLEYSRRCSDKIIYAYGLSVFGIYPSADLKWKTLFDSKSIDLKFASAEDAGDACVDNMIQAIGSPEIVGAQCQLSFDKGSYFYQIVTQNPLAKQ